MLIEGKQIMVEFSTLENFYKRNRSEYSGVAEPPIPVIGAIPIPVARATQFGNEDQ